LEDKEKLGRVEVVLVEVRVGKHLRDSLAGLHGVVRGEGEDLEFPICFEALDTWGGTHVCDCFRGPMNLNVHLMAVSSPTLSFVSWEFRLVLRRYDGYHV